MVAGLALGIAATTYVGWSIGAGVDAADTATTPPAGAQWTGLGLLAMPISAISFIGAAVYQSRSRRPSSRIG